MKKIKNFIRKLFYGKSAYQKLFKRLHRASLLGMNYGTDPKIEASGEIFTIKMLARNAQNNSWTVFDVGANTGEYTQNLLREFGESISIHAFEPSPVAFKELSSINDPRVKKHNIGISDKMATATLYANTEGSGLGSLYQRRLDYRGTEMNTRETIQLQSLDGFCDSHSIKNIDFLKLDTEGHEFQILKGAAMLNQERIKRIQFEFGGCNIDSRTFFQDFWYLLSGKYKIYRILKNGLCQIAQYDERDEIFTTTNYLAVLKNLTENEKTPQKKW